MREYQQRPAAHRAPRRAPDGRPRTPRDNRSCPPGRPRSISSVMHLQRAAGHASVVQLLAGDEEERSPVHTWWGPARRAPGRGRAVHMESAFRRQLPGRPRAHGRPGVEVG